VTAFSALSPAEVRRWADEAGHRGYRATQLLRWFYRSPAGSFDDMTNIPPTMRQELAREFAFSTLAPLRMLPADGGATRKYLFAHRSIPPARSPSWPRVHRA
jgi:23S rRNA (adenine2503-C2)-methyltransferase